MCAYAIAILAKFDPVFSTINCAAGEQSFDDPRIGEPTIVAGNATMYCDNSNPYGMKVVSVAPGRVLVNNSHTQIGVVTVEPFEMVAKGVSKMGAEMNMSFSMNTAVWMLSQKPVHVLLELNMQATASVDVILTTLTIVRDQSAKCAFAMEASLPLKRGPTICARTAAELEGRIPPIDSNQTVSFAFSPDPQELATMDRALHAACGVALALFGGLGFALSYMGVLLLRRARSPRYVDSAFSKSGGCNEGEGQCAA